MQLGLAVKSSALVVWFGTGILTALVLDLLVLSPLRGIGSLEDFYAPLDGARRTSIAMTVVAWVLVSGAVISLLAFRLRSRATWAWNFAYSPWRITRSILTIVGVVFLGSAFPGYVVGSAPIVSDSTESTVRNWELLGTIVGVGGFAIMAAMLMYGVGAAVVVAHEFRERRGKGIRWYQ